MFFPFPLFMAIRYTNLKRRDSFITFISLVSMIGIALSVMVLITVLSVMNGFSREIRTRMLNVTPHVNVNIRGGETNWAPLNHLIAHHSGVEGTSPYIEGQGMLLHHQNMLGIVTKGIIPDQIDQVFPLTQSLVQGAMKDLVPNRFGVIIGKKLSEALGVTVGESLILLVPEVNISLVGVTPRLKRLTIVGIFDAGSLYDGHLIFLHLADAAKIFKVNGITGIQAKLKDPFQSSQIRLALNRLTHYKYDIIDWTLVNSQYFSAVKMEKTMMFLTLMLILALAVFNLISTLVMVVTDKRSDIAILRTLGASRQKIMAIFMCQGSIIGVVGTLMGVLLGVILALNVTSIVNFIQYIFEVRLLSPDVYFLDYLPSELLLTDVLVIAGSSLVLSLLATLHPSWRASTIIPAQALRYDK